MPEEHEFAVAKFFSDLGKDVEFIRPSNIPNIHTPDIHMDGVDWEIKSPQGQSKRTLENNLRKALLQSKNIIFDLRRLNLPENECINKLTHEFQRNSKVRKLLIIKHDGSLVENIK